MINIFKDKRGRIQKLILIILLALAIFLIPVGIYALDNASSNNNSSSNESFEEIIIENQTQEINSTLEEVNQTQEINSTLEEVNQTEIWIDTIITIEDNATKIYLKLDNGTILPNQKLTVQINQTIIVTEKTNSEGYTKPNFDLYNASPGIYSVRVDFWGLPTQYLNPSFLEFQIEILEDGKIRILSFEETEEVIKEQPEIQEEIIIESNETNLTTEPEEPIIEEEIIVEEVDETIPLNLVCEEFTEQVLWSSGFSSKPKGSEEYYTWYLENSCPNCILADIEIQTRIISNSPEETNLEGQGYVQISEPDELICDNPEKGVYESYLFYENVQGGEYKTDKYCDKNPNTKCEEVFVGEYGSASCYGIKTSASQYSIVDVFEIKYKLCKEN